MKKQFFSLMLAVLLIMISQPVLALGARSVGMGAAYTALSDDANAVFYNPAGLGRFETGLREVSVMLKANERDRQSFDSLAVTGQLFREEEKRKFSISEYLNQDFRPELHEKVLYFNYAVAGQFLRTNTLDEYFNADSAYFAFGRKISSIPNLLAGMTLQATSIKTRDDSGNVASISLGALYDFNEKVTMGLVLQDLFKNGPYVSPIIMNLGVSINIAKSTVLAVDGYNLTSENSSWRFRNNGQAEFRLGLEKRFINDTLILRAGSKNGNLNLGMGIQVTPAFRLDYAYNSDNQKGTIYDPLEQQHFISADISF